MSTRKSERDSSLSLDDRPTRQSEPSTLTVQIREQSDHLAKAIGVRLQIRQSIVKKRKETRSSEATQITAKKLRGSVPVSATAAVECPAGRCSKEEQSNRLAEAMGVRPIIRL